MRYLVISAGMGDQSALIMREIAQSLRDVDPGSEADVDVVALRDYIPELASALTIVAPERLRRLFADVAKADGVVLHTSIMNASFSGLLKLFLDVLPEGTLAGVPVLMVGTGGTPRHSLALDYALRPVLTYLRAQVLPTTVFVATSDWGSQADAVRSIDERIERGARELVDAVGGLPRGDSAGSRGRIAEATRRAQDAGDADSDRNESSGESAGESAGEAGRSASSAREQAAAQMGSFDVSHITDRLKKL